MLSFRLSLIWILAALPLAHASAQAQGQPAPAATQAPDPPILPPPPSVLLAPTAPPGAQADAAQLAPPPVQAAPPPSGLVAPVPPQLPPKAPFIEFTTMRLMLEKGYITQAEFDSAMRDLGVSIGARGADSMTLVVGKIATTIYGFAQADVMYHSTQSWNDYAGNLQIARPGTFSGDHGRTEFSARDSRFGFRLQAPALPWLRASGLLEMDFLGPSGNIGSTTTEASFFNNPLLRIRHAYLKLETPIVDILFGHYWHLFGWQPSYVPADVQWSGVVGSLFSRTMQLRISKTVKTKAVTLDFAIAGMRPPQRDSSIPEFEAGARIAFNQWTGVHTLYVTSTQVMAASIGISGDLRRFAIPEFSAAPKSTNDATSLGFAVDAFLPIIPIRNGSRDNSLSIVGEFVTGQSINDLYVGLNGGVASPPLPGMNGAAGGTFNPDVDAGLAVYDISGEVRLPHWMTFIVGAEYYPPKVDGRIGLFANFARTQLMDSNMYANPAKVRDNELFYNGGIFGDLSAAVRLGIDYAYYDDQYADGVHATTHAVQGTGFFFF